MVARKVTLTATIVAIALLAAGIGFAYTSSTQNIGNIASNEYVTLVQGGEGAYKFANNVVLEWNTSDKKVGSTPVTEFTMVGMTPATGNHMDGFNIKQLGNSFTILTGEIGMGSHPDLECTITKAGTWDYYGEDFQTTFFLKVENGTTTTWFKYAYVPWNPAFERYNESTSKWDGGSFFDIAYDSANSKYYDTTVTVYYAIDGDVLSVEHSPGVFPDGPPANPLAGAFLIFTVNN